ncbi:MAG TPA: D-tyrosyl-tRNA(Tyr) deacylase [Chloroflexi bacterium]|nr:D-tyrosyl-tRNA(Tyr) deacylase [Chloroflexota bacterium]HCU98706.1 D-tyrosyl-tRNA(Tyr) deacylase [Chloroflexota bacterium]|tara:strand:- start:287 stop:736 length:450 start_codon:yes stop_codon:yes gene_type:complete
MRLLIQRVNEASVTVDEKLISSINKGLLVFVGIGQQDSKSEAQWLANKVAKLRIFPDEFGKTNLSLKDVSGSALVVSQFTLYAETKKGLRPSFINAAHPEYAKPLIQYFAEQLQSNEIPVQLGQFGADMKIALINNGPVTIYMERNPKS